MVRALPERRAFNLPKAIREPVKVRNAVAGNYQEYLEPLIEGLRSAGVDLETGVLIDAAGG